MSGLKTKMTALLGATLCAATLVSPAYAQESTPVGPQNFSVGMHNYCGDDTRCPQHEALEELLPHLDMIRIGNNNRPPIEFGDPDGDLRDCNNLVNNPNIYDVDTRDRSLRHVGRRAGYDRLLLVVNDKEDCNRPEGHRMVEVHEETARAFPRIKYLQVGNEESNFGGLTPEEYVYDYLLPVSKWKVQENEQRNRYNNANAGIEGFVPRPELEIGTASWYGDEGGAHETVDMLFHLYNASNGDLHSMVDFIGVHDYQDGPQVIKLIGGVLNALQGGDTRTMPMFVTETGINNTDLHDEYITKSLVAKEKALQSGYRGTKKQHIFWYQHHTIGDNHPLIRVRGDGAFVEPESGADWHPSNADAWNAIRSRVRHERAPVSTTKASGSKAAVVSSPAPEVLPTEIVQPETAPEPRGPDVIEDVYDRLPLSERFDEKDARFEPR